MAAAKKEPTAKKTAAKEAKTPGKAKAQPAKSEEAKAQPAKSGEAKAKSGEAKAPPAKSGEAKASAKVEGAKAREARAPARPGKAKAQPAHSPTPNPAAAQVPAKASEAKMPPGPGDAKTPAKSSERGSPSSFDPNITDAAQLPHLWQLNCKTPLLPTKYVTCFDSWAAFAAKIYGPGSDSGGLKHPSNLDSDDYDWALLTWDWIPSYEQAEEHRAAEYPSITEFLQFFDDLDADDGYKCGEPAGLPHQDKETHLVYTKHHYLLLNLVNTERHIGNEHSYKTFKITVTPQDEPAVRDYLQAFTSDMAEKLKTAEL